MNSKISNTQIDSTRHKDKRVNIPTRELRDFVAEDEERPGAMLYPRDPSLDPQLVWKGKDEQDREALAVPVVPVYIQEKIHPQAIIEDIRHEAGKGRTASGGDIEQFDLFRAFNGGPVEFDQRVDFYHHEQNWTNRAILGDSLLVMTSLAEKEGLKGKVQMIYLDPPYGIKFGSNWQVSTKKRDVKDGKAQDLTRQPEQIRAFRDTWKLGIHSYLAYMRERLVVARDLLSESGSIFIQIGEENQHLIHSLLDEVFGSENKAGIITFRKTSGLTSGLLAQNADFLLWYAKDIQKIKYKQLYLEKGVDSNLDFYGYIELPDGTRRRLTSEDQLTENTEANPYSVGDLTSSHFYADGTKPFKFQGQQYSTGNRYWTTSLDGMNRLALARRIHESSASLRYVRFLTDFPVQPLTANWSDTITGQYSDPRLYVVQTGTKVVQRCMLMTTDPGDLVLDPTCGSGTTAYVAEQWGRRWITVDTSRVALALARTRLMSARYPFFLLADSTEGIKKEAELTGKTPPPFTPGGDIRKGFVTRRVPHITLKSIANNEEIDTIDEKWRAKLEPLRARLNKALKQSWEEWQVPREAEAKWPADARKAHAEWWQGRRERQAAIDASIARAADIEYLHDQPFEEPRTVRVAGPFTVESLSPHRVLATDEDAAGKRPADPDPTPTDLRPRDFTQVILENLKSAGVQNTRRNERLKFERVEPFAGLHLHAEGSYTDRKGESRRAAIHIGPEFGTVRAEDIKEAAKEGVRGAGFDLMIVLGLAFDAHASETAREFMPDGAKDGGGDTGGDGFAVAEDERRYGRLPVLLARINPDLAMGDEVLKKTGAGNLFTVFGEPDIVPKPEKDGRLRLEIKGVDIYDPTTGQIRSSSPDEIACWFIDTDYNGEAFFVRHAYFTGGDEPYEKLKRALRAEIDEAAWSALYSTTSRPFPKPETGKIAVKVINHYGDEVLKVYGV